MAKNTKNKNKETTVVKETATPSNEDVGGIPTDYNPKNFNRDLFATSILDNLDRLTSSFDDTAMSAEDRGSFILDTINDMREEVKQLVAVA